MQSVLKTVLNLTAIKAPVLTLYGSSQHTSQPPLHAGSEEHTAWKLAGRLSGGGEKMLTVELTAACRTLMVFVYKHYIITP